MINKIIADCGGVKIDIEDDGRVYIATPDDAMAQKARRTIEGIAKDVEVGDVFTRQGGAHYELWRVRRICSRQGRMIHISKLSNERVEKCEDVVKIGDELESPRGGN